MKLVFYFTSLLLLVIFPQVSLAVESVTSFDSEITVNQDTSVTLTETIEYQTDEAKHGIYRYVPYKYSINGLNYTTDIELQSITDESGVSYGVSKTRESGNINWRIGDADITFTGRKTYVIGYQVSDILQRFEHHDELYIDVTGEGWQFPVEKSSAVITSEYAEIDEVQCFSGSFGATDGFCEVTLLDPNKAIVRYDRAISYGDNLTVAVKLSQDNQLLFPTQTQKFIKKLLDNLWLFFAPLPILIMLYLWYIKGRDLVFISPNIFDMNAKPERLRPIFEYNRTPMVYQPLHELTPGEAGTILDEVVHNRDVVAEILELARKKYLLIEPITKGKLIFKTKDYKFVKLKDSDDQLPKHQSYLLDKIFKSRKEKNLSDLKGSFYIAMNEVKKQLYDSAQEKKLFTSNPRTIVTKYTGLFLALVIGAIVISMVLVQGETPLPLFVTGLQLFLLPFVGKVMVQKSARGSNFYLQAKGLKETIRRGAWRQKINERNLFVEEVLPFAISFNVVNQLSNQMEELNIRPPSYMSAAGWSTQNFSKSLNDFGTQATKSLSYNPSSSSGGGSGFSGGSSGGGFSGGGGGSW